MTLLGSNSSTSHSGDCWESQVTNTDKCVCAMCNCRNAQSKRVQRLGFTSWYKSVAVSDHRLVTKPNNSVDLERAITHDASKTSKQHMVLNLYACFHNQLHKEKNKKNTKKSSCTAMSGHLEDSSGGLKLSIASLLEDH